MFDPIWVVLGRVDDLQRDVPDQIVLSHVLLVDRVHNDPKVRSVGVVDVVGRLWVEVVRGVDVIFRHDILQQVGKSACRVGESCVRNKVELCGARFEHPFREPGISIVALCENEGGDRLTCVGEDFSRSGFGEYLIALRDER